jgi:hypothetical protein
LCNFLVWQWWPFVLLLKCGCGISIIRINGILVLGQMDWLVSSKMDILQPQAREKGGKCWHKMKVM